MEKKQLRLNSGKTFVPTYSAGPSGRLEQTESGKELTKGPGNNSGSLGVNSYSLQVYDNHISGQGSFKRNDQNPNQPKSQYDDYQSSYDDKERYGNKSGRGKFDSKNKNPKNYSYQKVNDGYNAQPAYYQKHDQRNFENDSNYHQPYRNQDYRDEYRQSDGEYYDYEDQYNSYDDYGDDYYYNGQNSKQQSMTQADSRSGNYKQENRYSDNRYYNNQKPDTRVYQTSNNSKVERIRQDNYAEKGYYKDGKESREPYEYTREHDRYRNVDQKYQKNKNDNLQFVKSEKDKRSGYNNYESGFKKVSSNVPERQGDRELVKKPLKPVEHSRANHPAKANTDQQGDLGVKKIFGKNDKRAGIEIQQDKVIDSTVRSVQTNETSSKLENFNLYFSPNQAELDQPKKQARFVNDAKYPHVKTIGKGTPLNVLMIAEKPSIALSLANCLGKKYESERGATPIFSYTSEFFGHRANFKVTSVTGHVYNRDFPEKYQNWTRTDPSSLYSVETVKTKADDKGKIIRHLDQVSRGQDVIVLWLDNDREGENICFEILDVIFDNLRSSNFRKVYRARFYSLEAGELRNTFLSLNDGPDLLMSSSVDGRQILDLKVGVSFTRFQSMFLKERYVEFKDKVVSFGPCQTPTLAFVVNRDKEIDDFVPRKYFKVSYMASTRAPQSDNLTGSSFKDGPLTNVDLFEITPVNADPSFFERSEALEHYKRITLKGLVSEVKVSSEKVEVPSALNTVNLLKHCCKCFNISAHNGLQIAESLYLQGYTTYPRTESTRYPKNFNFKQIIQSTASFDNNKYREWSQELEQYPSFSPPEGIDMGDHPPIIPTSNLPSSSSLSELEYKVYDYILRNFLSTISKKPQIEVTTFHFLFGETKYTLRKKRLTTPSFLKYTNSTKYQSCNDKVSLEKHQALFIHPSPLEEKFTCSPKRMTESNLLELMDKFGIGTDASMATHINNLIVREYVSVEGSNRTIVSNSLGRRIIEFYNTIDKELISPQLRGNMEKALDRIAKSQDIFENVVSDMLSTFFKKFLNFKKNIEMLQSSLSSDFKTVEQSVLVEGKPFTKCGNCNRFMNYSDYAEIMKCQFCPFKCSLPKCPKPRKLNTTCRQQLTLADSQTRCCNFQEIQYREKFKLGNEKFSVYITICPNCFVNEPGYYSQPQYRLGKCRLCPNGDLYLANGKCVNEFYYKCSDRNCVFLQCVLQHSNAPSVVSEDICKCSLRRLSFRLLDKHPGFKDESPITACPLCDPAFKESVKDISAGINVTGKKEHKKFKKGGTRGRRPGKRGG